MIRVYCARCEKFKRTRRIGLISCSRHRENRPRHETNAQCFSRVKVLKSKPKGKFTDEIKTSTAKSNRKR